MRGGKGAVAAAALLLLVSACGYAGGSPRNGLAADRTPDRGFAGFLGRSSDLGPADPSTTVDVTFAVQDPMKDARERAVEAIATPGSPTYGSWASPEQIAAAYGPAQAIGAPAVAWFTGRGLKVTWKPGDLQLAVRGTVGQIDALLHTDVHGYRSPDGKQAFVASRVDPQVPGELRASLSGADHLSTYQARKNAAYPVKGYSAKAMSKAYGVDLLREKGGVDGSGVTVSIWALGDNYSQANVDKWLEIQGMPAWKPVRKAGPANGPEEGEMIMDIEAVHAMAPGAQVFVYTTPTSEVLSNLNQASAFFDQMIRDNPNGIWSFSWGGCEQGASQAEAQAFASIYQKAAAAGITVFQSTGDSGAYRCLDFGKTPEPGAIGVELESAVAFGVTAVGGTRLSVQADGSYYNEVVWAEPTSTQGTGGGFSTIYKQPSWQHGAGIDSNSMNPRHGRMVPDVAAVADPVSGLQIVAGGHEGQGGGTSLATPLWAGIAALIQQYLKKQGLKPLGFLNPALYDIYNGKAPYAAFHDVQQGTNLVYPAGPGYDMATGLGSPEAWNLARDLEQWQRNGGKI